MKKHIYIFIAIFALATQAFGQVTPSFDIYSYASRFGSKTTSYHSQNGFAFAELLTHGSIYSSNQNKWDQSKIDYFLNKNFPSSSSSGSVVIDWETNVFKDLRDYPTSDSRFKYAEDQFLSLVNYIKKQRPNVKVAIYGMPYRVWGDWQVKNYNPGTKYDNLLSKTDFLTPSLYHVFADEEVGHERNIQYLKDNLDIALTHGKRLGKPVIPFIWHKIHDYNKVYGREIIQKDVLVKYLKYISGYSFNGTKARGVIWWDEASESDRLGDLSGINNHLNGKLVGSTNAEKYDNLMLDYSKAMVQMLQSGSSAPAPAPAPEPTPAPAPAPAPGTGEQQVESFTLFDAYSMKEIATLTNGSTLNLATLPSKSLNIRANTNTKVGSVKFVLSGAQSKSVTESLAPYDLMGDDGKWVPAAGDYTIKATPYSSSGGSGTAGAALSVSFKVVDAATSFVLVNADTKQDIQSLTSGSTLNLASLPTKNLNIRYTSNEKVGSVKFVLSGAQSKSVTESLAPYDLMGDDGKWVPAAGDYTIKATPYSSSGGSGTAGAALSVSFKVVDAASSFVLVNADTKQDIQSLTSGSTLNLASLPTKNLNIRYTSNEKVGSVKFVLSGAQSKSVTESLAPYDLMGDDGKWVPAAGDYTIKATPYSSSGGSGTAGAALSVSFKVVDQLNITATSTKSSTAISISSEDGLVAYPNPATSFITIEYSGAGEGAASLKLYDTNGNEVLAQKEEISSEGLKTVLDVSNLREGLYTLVVETSSERITKRILVQ